MDRDSKIVQDLLKELPVYLADAAWDHLNGSYSSLVIKKTFDGYEIARASRLVPDSEVLLRYREICELIDTYLSYATEPDLLDWAKAIVFSVPKAFLARIADAISVLDDRMVVITVPEAGRYDDNEELMRGFCKALTGAAYGVTRNWPCWIWMEPDHTIKSGWPAPEEHSIIFSQDDLYTIVLGTFGRDMPISVLEAGMWAEDFVDRNRRQILDAVQLAAESFK